MGGTTIMRDYLDDFITENYGGDAEAILSYLPDRTIDLASIKAVMINEVVAATPDSDFYSQDHNSNYMQTTLTIFHKAGVDVKGIDDILKKGIYITSAIKLPKEGTTVDTDSIKRYVPILEKELALFPSLEVIMLMGDVARKAVNMITKKETKKNAVPTGSTYKLRHTEISYKGIRLLPAYIMTGKNLAIEKSKTEMSAEEVSKMMGLIGAVN